MILLLLSSGLLLFITFGMGLVSSQMLERLFGCTVPANLFDIFLLGLIGSFIYFNLLSFFFPVNFYSLIPLAGIGTIVLVQKKKRLPLVQQLNTNYRFLFRSRNLPLLIPFGVLFLAHAIFPPANWDSSGYHFTAIKWYEQYKVVPGLANVHARLAYNPANFVISAAYSFSSLVGQTIYPLNGVVALLFYAWLLKKILYTTATIQMLALLACALLLFRATLVNIAAPSSDLLSNLLLFYCGFRLYELAQRGKQPASAYLYILLFICFSLTCKLSAIPSLLAIPVCMLFYIEETHKLKLSLKLTAVMMFILLPWVCRNMIMSGYLLYPIFGTNLIHFDWTVPLNVIKLDYVFSKYGPHVSSEAEFTAIQQMDTVERVVLWIQHTYRDYTFGFLLVLASILSPFAWLVVRVAGKKIALLPVGIWFIYYLCFWVWIINSPEFRFGLAYITLSIFLPFMEVPFHFRLRENIKIVGLSLPVYLLCFHYIREAIHKDSFYTFTLADCWIKPLRSYRYFINNDIKTFRYVPLRNGIKLYISDVYHECLNVEGPCMIWKYGEIEMRGPQIADGFRNVKDEVKEYYPYIQSSK
jgi:hypothetical protein